VIGNSCNIHCRDRVYGLYISHSTSTLAYQVFNEVSLPTAIPVMIHADNHRSILNIMNNKNYWWTKYVDVKHHFVKQRTKLEQVTFNYIPSAKNITDFFTKLLPQDAILRFVKILRLYKHQNAMIQRSVEHGSLHQEYYDNILGPLL